MGKVVKRPIVVKDLIELATYIADGNLDISDNFLLAAEKTYDCSYSIEQTLNPNFLPDN